MTDELPTAPDPNAPYATAPQECGVSEAATILGVHPDTVRSYGDTGILHYRKTPGGHRRFIRADVVNLRAKADATP